MTHWSPQQYRAQAQRSGIDPDVVAHALATAEYIRAVSPALPPVFTLRHLAHLADADYGLLRTITSRVHDEPYRLFRIRKRPSYDGEMRFRVIAVPDPGLKKTQRWIAQSILAHVRPHPSSVAFSKGDRLVDAVQPHCGARWIVKMDVRNFFESVSEISAYRVFHSLGYQPLVSMELARICTRLGKPTLARTRPRWRSSGERSVIQSYNEPRLGHLPQGAPTSPMLSNLAVREFDRTVEEIARKFEVIYTRYADDLTFSTIDQNFNRDRCRSLIGKVSAAMGEHGFSPNVTKTSIQTPGSRKLVLGLLVDGPTPRLTREFRNKMRQHLHYLSSSTIGPSEHAKHLGFTAIRGLKNHVYGLAMFARQVDRPYGEECLEMLNSVDWPV